MCDQAFGGIRSARPAGVSISADAGNEASAVGRIKWAVALLGALLVSVVVTCPQAHGQPTAPFSSPEQHAITAPHAHFSPPTVPTQEAPGTAASTVTQTPDGVVLRNAFLEVGVAPELGGRMTHLVDLATGQDMLYSSAHPAPGTDETALPGGPAATWCLPGRDQGYRWEPVWSWSVVTSTSGTTLTLQARELREQIQVSIDLFLPSGYAYLVVQPHLTNPESTSVTLTLATHASPRPRPAANLALPGATSSRVFTHGASFDAIYDRAQDAGLVRAVAPGAPEGYHGLATGWDPAWTCGLPKDDAPPRYAAPGALAIPAHNSVTWREVWYPVRELGNVVAATSDGAMGVTHEEGRWHVAVQTTESVEASTCDLSVWHAATCTELVTQPVVNGKATSYSLSAAGMANWSTDAQVLAVTYTDRDGKILVSHGPTECATSTATSPHLSYGVNARDPVRAEALFPSLGFGWIRFWDEYPESRLPLPTSDLYQILYNINCGAYIDELDGWRAHVRAIAQAGRGTVRAYEICNEPNVRNACWGGRTPDPARFAQMLCIAHDEIKTVDPGAWIVSGGLAPVGRIASSACGPGNDCEAMDEQTYLAAMLDAGAGPCIDAFGYHPYGFAYPPEQDPDSVANAFAFRGVEKLRAILVNRGWDKTPVWATEFNWIRKPADDGYEFSCDTDPDYSAAFLWQEVSAEAQADYLVRAFQYADTHWPWMQGMFTWNLDWHDYLTWLPCFHSRYYALRRHTTTELGTATPAYDALIAMPKRPAGLETTPVLQVAPLVRHLAVPVTAPRTLQTAFDITNVGIDTLYWKVTRLSTSTLPANISSIWGPQGWPLTVTVDTTGLRAGIYTAALRIEAIPDTTQQSPQTVSVIVDIVNQVHLYLPVLLRQPAFDLAPAPTPAPQGKPSKIGIHAIGEGGTLDFVRHVADGGAHVAVVKAVTSFSYLCDVKRISPKTVTVGRWANHDWETIVPTGDPADKARTYLNQHMAQWQPYRDCVDYWEVLNEVDPNTIEGHAWLAEFHKAAMDIASASGYKLALFSYSLGVPEIYEWQAIADTGVFAQAKAEGHILSLHEYGWPHMDDLWGEPLPQYPGQDSGDPDLPRYPDRGIITGRYRHLYRDILIPRGEVIPLVITETNLAIEDPDERALYFLEEIAWYDDRLREDDYVIGMTIFTLGGIADWEAFSYTEFLPALARRIIALKDE